MLSCDLHERLISIEKFVTFGELCQNRRMTRICCWSVYMSMTFFFFFFGYRNLCDMSPNLDSVKSRWRQAGAGFRNCGRVSDRFDYLTCITEMSTSPCWVSPIHFYKRICQQIEVSIWIIWGRWAHLLGAWGSSSYMTPTPLPFFTSLNLAIRFEPVSWHPPQAVT